MDYNPCKEICMHFFTNHTLKPVPSFTICLDKNFASQMNIPKLHLTKIRDILPTIIRLMGPTGQTHRVVTKSTGERILLTNGWNGFVSCYSLQRREKLIFSYEGDGLFSVEIYDQNGCEIKESRCTDPSSAQKGLRGKNGKGKQCAEAEASSGLIRNKRGRVEHGKTNIDTDSEKWTGPVYEKEPTPPLQMDISSDSGDNSVRPSIDANAGEGPSRGKTGKGKNVAVEFNSACNRIGRGWANEVSSDTEEESCSSDSLIEIEKVNPKSRKVMPISSSSFHESEVGLKGQTSQNKRVKKEPGNSNNSDLKIFGQKRAINKEKSRAKIQAASFRSKNPYFLKEMSESYINRNSQLNVQAEFARNNLPRKHGEITLRLPQGSTSWRVECGYSCQSRPQWYFCKGWLDFTRDNNLTVGDCCVFELTRKKKIEMMVHLFRAV